MNTQVPITEKARTNQSMKVFIYRKDNSKKVKVIKNVKVVFETAGILVVDTEHETFTYNTKDIKTTIYQN